MTYLSNPKNKFQTISPSAPNTNLSSESLITDADITYVTTFKTLAVEGCDKIQAALDSVKICNTEFATTVTTVGNTLTKCKECKKEITDIKTALDYIVRTSKTVSVKAELDEQSSAKVKKTYDDFITTQDKNFNAYLRESQAALDLHNRRLLSKLEDRKDFILVPNRKADMAIICIIISIIYYFVSVYINLNELHNSNLGDLQFLVAFFAAITYVLDRLIRHFTDA